MKTVLITGGNGYLGSALVENFLKKNYKVIVIDGFFIGKNFIRGLKKKNLIIFKDKTKNINSILSKKYEINLIVHCANLVGEEACKKNKGFLEEINYKDTIRLLKFSDKNKVQTFVYISTCSNYGYSKKNKFLTEKSRLNPKGLYAKSKVKSELAVLNYKNNYSKNIILRLGTLYGVAPKIRFDLLINDLVRAIYFKEKLEIYSPETWRPYLHVNDAARIVSELVTKNKRRKECLNICSENIIKIKLVKLISKILNSKSNIKINYSKKGMRDYKVSSEKLKRKYKIKFKKNIKNSIYEIFNFLKKSQIRPNEIKKYFNGVYKVTK